MARNELFTMKVKDAKTLRKMLREVKDKLRASSFEDAIVTMVRFIFPDIAIKYYPIILKPMIVGGENGGKSSGE